MFSLLLKDLISDFYYYEQNHQYDIHVAADELFMTYKMSIEISMQNVMGVVM